MKKKKVVLFIVILSTIILSACGSKKISNDFISINQYIGLKVERPKNEDDEQKIENFKNEIWDTLLEHCTVKKISQEELDNLIEEIKIQYSYVSYFENKNVSDMVEELHGMTVEELAKEQLKKQYAIELIAEKEGLLLSDKEYNRALQKRADENGIDDAQEYENMFGREQLYSMFLEERIFEFIKENLK